MLNRRLFAAAAALGSACVGVPVLLAQPKPERSKVTIAVGGKASFYHLPLTVAEQLGYFQAEGLSVEVNDFSAGSRALQAVVGGSADVVSGAYEQTIGLQGKGQFFQSFVLQGRAPQVAIGVSTRNLPDYRGLADLRGKTIGVSAPGSSTNMAFNLVLSRAGLKPGDVRFVGVGTAAGALAAVRSGQIDAMSNTDPVMTLLEQQGELRIVSDTRTLKGTQEVFGGPMPAGCLHAPLAFVQEYPATCQALANAIVHSLKWLQTAGPADLIKVVPEAYLLDDRALYLASFGKLREAIALDGLLPEAGARTALRALASVDPQLRPDKVDLAKTFTNTFAQRAKDKFRA